MWEGDAMSPVCRPPVRPVFREVVGRSSNVAKAARGAGYSEVRQSAARVHLLSKAARQNLPDQSLSQSQHCAGFDNEITF